MNEDERLAGVAIEEVIPGARMEFREEQHGDGGLRHDFWLYRPDRDRAALEVTSVRDENRMRVGHKISEYGRVIEAEYCNRSWAVWLNSDVRYLEIKESIDQRLAELEKQGIERVRPVRSVSDPSTVREVRSELSVDHAAASANERATARLHLHIKGTGDYVHAGKVSDAVETEAEKNRGKLDETGAVERHLFVYAMHTDAAASALTMSDPGEDSPNLPSEVTHVWAAACRLVAYNEFVVWRARSGEPWRSAGVVTVPGGGPAPLP